MNMNQGEHEAGVEKKPKSSQSSGILVKLFSNTIGFYVGLAIFDPISRLFEHSQKLIGPYVKKGQVVADIGCGLGNNTLFLAENVGQEGKVYAIDLDKKCVQALEKKAEKAGYRNVEAHVSSASDLSFIKDGSVDFILADGLLWSMAKDRQLFVNETKRILKSDGQAYLSLGAGSPWGYTNREEWEQTMDGFNVDKGGSYKEKWAVVSLKRGTV